MDSEYKSSVPCRRPVESVSRPCDSWAVHCSDWWPCIRPIRSGNRLFAAPRRPSAACVVGGDCGGGWDYSRGSPHCCCPVSHLGPLAETHGGRCPAENQPYPGVVESLRLRRAAARSDDAGGGLHCPALQSRRSLFLSFTR